MKLGVLGGSFNPVHHGHLVIAERAAETLGLGRVLLIPTAQTPLKEGAGLISARDRLHMVRLAIKENPLLRASDLEVRRGGTSYTIDTVRCLAAPHRDIYLIIGTDAAADLSQWRSIRELARLCTFAIAGRPVRGRVRVPTYIVERRVAGPLLEISSSEIRARARRGLSIRYLVPPAVERYVRRRGLYRV